MDDFEKELKIGFLDEAAQAVADVEQCFLGLEQNSGDSENLNKIFRLAHNLKGSSKAVGFDEFGAFTHRFESFILKVKNGDLKASKKVVDLLLRANDHVLVMINGLRENLAASFDSSALLSEMENFTEAEVSEDPSPSVEEEVIQFEMPSVEAHSLPENSFEVGNETPPEPEDEPVVEAHSESKIDEALEIVEEPASVSTAPVAPLPGPVAAVAPQSPKKTQQPAKSGGSGAGEETLRVALAKVETLINFVGEMVILQSVMREQAGATNSLLLKNTVHQLGKVGKEIQDIAMGLRMVPVKPTFQKMQRIVRDTAQALNKEINFVLAGEETELDKTVLEKINDPLVHLIRNSVDHGVESADIRLSRGKAAKGQVNLSAFQNAGKLVLEVKDDGGGLDPEKLKRKATEKGILKSGTALTDKEALNLIFAPGFSTKEQVTDVSGRGVGMDVVRTNITELGGEIQIESEVGRGTTFRVILPLSLAIIDSMVLVYSGEKFVIPLNHVFETLRPQTTMVQHNENLGDVLMLRGDNLPMIRLGDFFGLKNSKFSTDMIAMVIRSGPKPFAILVDDIIGQFQVVIKQLGPELQGIKGVSGSTILGDGKPALILEPQELFKRKIGNYFVPPKEAIKGGDLAGGKAA